MSVDVNEWEITHTSRLWVGISAEVLFRFGATKQSHARALGPKESGSSTWAILTVRYQYLDNDQPRLFLHHLFIRPRDWLL